MMKSEKGITMVSLVVSVIILMILAGIGITGGYETIEKVKDDRLIGELGIVNQAITQQYSKAVALNQTKMSGSAAQVSFWVGERIDDSSKKMDLPDKSTLEDVTEDIDALYQNAEIYNFDYQEDYYYRLSPADLDTIGMKNAKDTYIVNYKTGEVYNETHKITRENNLLYLESTLNN